MVEKRFITAQELLEDSFRLGRRVLESGFRPDFIVGVWRGGTPVGIAVQELLEHNGVSSDHIAIRTSSYEGIEKRGKQIRASRPSSTRCRSARGATRRTTSALPPSISSPGTTAPGAAPTTTFMRPTSGWCSPTS
jgi:hypothetical protein